MRPVRIIATAVVVALAVTGCSSRSADQTAAPASSAPTTQPTTRASDGSVETTTATLATSANASCALSPARGPAGDRVTLSCRGFAPSERVEVTFSATVLATAKATAGGQVAASFAVPSGFAGSTIPGRKDTFQAKGRQSGKAASATFTVANPAKATSCVLSPTKGLAGSRVTLSCRGFAPSEQVAITFGAEVLASAKATAGGQVTARFAVPSGFAGSHYPGRKDRFQAKGGQSGTVASGTFTVTG